MIKSPPLTLTMKAWPNCQKNICLFVWSFLSSLYYISGAPPWYTNQLKPSAARRELFLSPAVIWMDLKAFSRAGSYWNLAGGFLQRRSLPMNTNRNTIQPHTYISTYFPVVTLEMVVISSFIIFQGQSKQPCLDIKTPCDLNHSDRLKGEGNSAGDRQERETSSQTPLIKSLASRDTQPARFNHSI